MKKTRDHIIKKIHTVWPHLVWDWIGPSNIFIPRNSYHAPTVGQFREFMDWDWTDQLPYNINFYACSNFAQTLSSRVDLYLFYLIDKGKLNPKEAVEWTLMEVWGTMFRGEQGGHAINMLLDAKDKLWLIEPQENWLMWTPNPKKDRVNFIKL